MGVLPRPDVPPGSHRDLVEALHRLHHRAGWPSLRVLAGEAGCSPTTVSAVFSKPRLPSWGVLELLVESMDGDVDVFRDLWLAAGSSPGERADGPPIAGRKVQLRLLRRHLAGAGGRLLLVTGEAGIGKTRLVSADNLVEDEVLVAQGCCLPFSTEVPLLPVAEMLRSVLERDAGQSLKEALADCPSYIPGALAPLLPEIGDMVEPEHVPEGAGDRQRLFVAVRVFLRALGTLDGWAVVIEDLHWADSATLDLLEHLLAVAGGPGLPIVGTYRTEDPETPPANADWFLRVQRLASVDVLEMSALDREETAEQLRLLGHRADPDTVERIHTRAEGHPLFVEQLAAQSAADQPLPTLLADLLDRRLDGLGTSAWLIARALGLADRPLYTGPLRAVTGLGHSELTAGLHQLDERRLLRTRSGPREAELRHPLLAEAVRRRLVAGEAADVHRRLAATLADQEDASAAEIAAHWRGADDPEQELVWRINAARAAKERFALAQEAEQWRRALELWPADMASAGSPGMRKSEAYLAAMDACMFIDLAGAAAVAHEAMRAVTDPNSIEAAEIYQGAAEAQGLLGDPEGGLALLEKAIRIYELMPPSAGYIRALARRQLCEDSLGRWEESAATASRAIEVGKALGEPAAYRGILAALALDVAGAGDLDLAMSHIREAGNLELTEPDPIGDVLVAMYHTSLLLMTAAGADDVAAAARPGLDAAEAWGLQTFAVCCVRGSVAYGMRRSGQVHRAAEIIDPITEDAPTHDRSPEHFERAALDLLRGRVEAALERFDALAAFPNPIISNQIEWTEDVALACLWSGRPGDALDRLVQMLNTCLVTDAAVESSRVLVLAARAAADLMESHPATSAERGKLLTQLRDLRQRATTDPLARHPVYAERRALAAAWAAEMQRLAGQATLERWAAAATEWDKLGRPHDAAYCRWRAAQLALRTGQAGAAAPLLRRAARDAREHVPLSAAIRESMSAPASDVGAGRTHRRGSS